MQRIVLLALTTILLLVNMPAWAAKESPTPAVQTNWTLEQLAQENNLPVETVVKQLGIPNTPALRSSTLQELQITEAQATSAIRKGLVLQTEEKSKNWKLILLKFSLWWLLAISAIILLKRNLVTPKRRTWLLAGAFILFGVILGSDPSPMGSIKDAIALYGAERTIFPPRLIAFTVFTLLVIVGNKLICGWGCQLGTLQDWLYQISPIKRKIRLPFILSNGIRIAVFVIFTLMAFAIPFDIISPIDPFKIFAPAHITLVSGIFIAAMLIGSLFFYRPWCTLVCPFGLTGWLAEYFSWFRIRWDQSKCIRCGACRRQCPTGHAGHLLDNTTIKADCYSCAACLHVCPNQALRYDRKP